MSSFPTTTSGHVFGGVVFWGVQQQLNLEAFKNSWKTSRFSLKIDGWLIWGKNNLIFYSLTDSAISDRHRTPPKSFPKGQWVIGLSELILWDVFSGLPKKQSLTHLQKLILQVQMFKQKSHNFQWFNLRNYDIHQVNPFLDTPVKTMKHPLLVSKQIRRFPSLILKSCLVHDLRNTDLWKNLPKNKQNCS